MAESTFPLPGAGPGLVTVSQGVTAALSGDGAEALVKRADQALYAAKAAGRDRVAVAE